MPCPIDASLAVAGPEAGLTSPSRPFTDGQLVGPELVLAEASNILRRLEQAGSISRIEATASHNDLLQLDIELFPFAPFAERVWELRGNLTCYDAWYVALAEALGPRWQLLTGG